MNRSLAPLTSAAVACRADPRVAAIDEIVNRVSVYIDPAPSWTVPGACEKIDSGLFRLLQRVAIHEPDNINPFHKHQNFKRAMVYAVRRGDLQVVQWLVETYLPSGKIREPVREAAAAGRLEILQWLWAGHASRLVWSHRERSLAAKNSHLETLQWLDEFVERPQINGFFFGEGYDLHQILGFAAENGRVEMMQWVDEQRQRKNIAIPNAFVETAMVRGARNGHRTTMEFLSERFNLAYPNACLTEAICGQHGELAQWLHARFGLRRCSVPDLVNAARSGNVELIRWVLLNLEVVNQNQLLYVIDGAASAGHLDVIQLLHDSFGEEKWSTDAMIMAAENGHLDVVIWLHEHRTEGCTSYAMDGAARSGHLDILQWLHHNRSEGCSTLAMNWAAECNHIDVIKWLHANRGEGCTEEAMDKAALNGHLEVLKWLHENRSEGCSVVTMGNAAGNNHLEVVKWLHENRSEGCTTRAMDDAASKGHLDVVKWLHANRSEGCSAGAFYGAARNGHADVMKWLLANKADAFSGDTMKFAAENGNFDVLTAVNSFVKNRYAPDLTWFRAALRGQNLEVLEWLECEYGESTPDFHDWLRLTGTGRSLRDPYAQEVVQRMLASRDALQ